MGLYEDAAARVRKDLIAEMIDAGFVLPYVVARNVTPELIVDALKEPDEQRRAWEHQGIDGCNRSRIERELVERMLAAGTIKIQAGPMIHRTWAAGARESARIACSLLDWLDDKVPRDDNGDRRDIELAIFERMLEAGKLTVRDGRKGIEAVKAPDAAEGLMFWLDATVPR